MLAEAARRQASAMASSSTRWSLTGGEVGCTIKTSLRRTGSRSCTLTSPSRNRSITHAPTGMPSSLAVAAAKGGLAVPARIVNRLLTLTSGYCGQLSPSPLIHCCGPQIPYLPRQYMLDVLNLSFADPVRQYLEHCPGDLLSIHTMGSEVLVYMCQELLSMTLL